MPITSGDIRRILYIYHLSASHEIQNTMIEARIEIEASKSPVRREQLSYLHTNFWGELHKVEETSRLNGLCPQYSTIMKKPRYVQIHGTRVTC